MSTPLDGNDDAFEQTPLSWLERLVLKVTPRYWRDQTTERLRKNYRQNPTTRAVRSMAELARLVPAMIVQTFSLGLFVADILVFGVAVHSYRSSAVLVCAAIAFAGLLIYRGYYYPYPESPGEAFTGAAASMTLLAVAVVGAIALRQTDIPGSLVIQQVITGLIGLTVTAMAHYYRRWNPEKYPEVHCAVRWAMMLDMVWFFCWYLLQGSTPAFSILWLCPVLTAFPILFTAGMYVIRDAKRSLFKPRIDSFDMVSLITPVRREAKIERTRDALFSFTGHSFEIMIACNLAIFFWAIFMRSAEFDPRQAWSNVSGGIMMFILLGYIRPANRRADALLEQELIKVRAERKAEEDSRAAD